MAVFQLGISPCPNDVFIFSGLLLGAIPTPNFQLETVFEDVETLNQRAQQGTIDIVKFSYANYLHIEKDYALLSSGGALGRGCGPLLLSNGGSWNPEGEVLSPGEFTTANFLLDYFAQKPLKRRYLPFDALYAELCSTPGAQGVVIHEKRFTFVQDGLTLVKDLGEHWEEQTGFAIPLGAIAIRRELGYQEEVDSLIRQSLQWAYRHYDLAFALCRQYAQDLNETVIKAHIDLYVNSFSEDLGAEGRAVIDYFFAQQRKFRGKA